MSTDRGRTKTVNPPGIGPVDAVGTSIVNETLVVEAQPIMEVIDVNDSPKDVIRWGPILAGVVIALAVMLFLTALGVALGLSAFGDDGNPNDWGTAAGIWGGLSLLASFFAGGWMAGRGSASGLDRNGLLNGFVAGAATLLLLIWLATSALTGALGFFASTVAGIGGAAAPAAIEAVADRAPAAPDTAEEAVANADDIAADADQAATEAGEAIEAAVPAEVEQQAQAAAETAGEVAAPSAWGTTIAILLALGAAAIGGMMGQGQRAFLTGSRVVTS